MSSPRSSSVRHRRRSHHSTSAGGPAESRFADAADGEQGGGLCHRLRALLSLFLWGPPKVAPPSAVRRKTLALDLDETLVHTSTSFDSRRPGSHGNSIAPELRLDVASTKHRTRVFYVRLRPHLNTFLRECSKLFDVVIFTASEQVSLNALVCVDPLPSALFRPSANPRDSARSTLPVTFPTHDTVCDTY